MNHPFLSPGLPIRWSQLTPDHIEPDITEALRRAQANIDAIASLPPVGAELTFASTFLALEEATRELGIAWGLVQHLDSVCNSPELRAANTRMLPEVSTFFARIPLNQKLWAVLRAWGESPAAATLTPVQSRFVTETMEDFRESGADLPGDKRARLEVVEAELAEITQKYSENVLDATNAWELVVSDESKLAGLPASARAAALASAKAKGHGTDDQPAWRFSLQMPSYTPLMEHLEDAAIREQAWRAMAGIGSVEPHDNTGLVWQILALRDEKAQLLGKASFADFTTNRRMAKSGATALEFTEKLHDRIAPAFVREQSELIAWRAKQLGIAPEPMEPWDIALWAERRRKAEYDLDDEQLRPYFPMNGVVDGMFRLCELLFGVRIEELPVAAADRPDLPEVWHPEVKFFQISDEGDGVRGYFYTDWFPRESKRGGAWMNSLRTGLPPVDGQARQPHVGLMCGNMGPPVDGKPALLTHGEVETVFHEFGHLLHHLLGEVPVRSLNGICVAWDFVELPSQIMENFCWDRRSLDFFAKHWETGERIPGDLFNRMIAARNYLTASTFMRQLAFGKMDLELHHHYAMHKGGDLDTICKTVLADYTVATRTPVPPMIRRFNHLFSSPTAYAAGYYSYKWAEALDADAFTRFDAAGVLAPDVGRAFRQCILSMGNSRPADVLFHDFMGRDPDPEPLLARAGLA